MPQSNKGYRSIGYGYNRPLKSKYGAKKTEVDGITFDSSKEAKRYRQLKALEAIGEISDLELQKEFELIPNISEPDTVGKRGGVKKGKVIERKVVYRADFCYKDKNGNLVVEDVKGCKIGAGYQIFKLKKKLMLWRYGISVREV